MAVDLAAAGELVQQQLAQLERTLGPFILSANDSLRKCTAPNLLFDLQTVTPANTPILVLFNRLDGESYTAEGLILDSRSLGV